MADAPERLWLWPAEPEDGADKCVSFPDQPYPSGSTEYIRADVARADAELAVAEAIRRAAQEAHDWFYDPEHDRVTDPRLGDAILTLAPADALAELQRIRAERDAALARVVEKAARDARDVFSDHKRAKEAVDYMEQLIYAAIRAQARADALAEVQRIRAERDAALARVEKLHHLITEASDPDFIWGALDNVHDAETTLDDYASAVSRAIRAAMQIKGGDA